MGSQSQKQLEGSACLSVQNRSPENPARRGELGRRGIRLVHTGTHQDNLEMTLSLSHQGELGGLWEDLKIQVGPGELKPTRPPSVSLPHTQNRLLRLLRLLWGPEQRHLRTQHPGSALFSSGEGRDLPQRGPRTSKPPFLRGLVMPQLLKRRVLPTQHSQVSTPLERKPQFGHLESSRQDHVCPYRQQKPRHSRGEGAPAEAPLSLLGLFPSHRRNPETGAPAGLCFPM